MSGTTGGCADEAVAPAGAPGPVDDTETVIKFVRVALSLGWDNNGRPYLLPAAIRKEDLEAKKPGKSVSVFREEPAQPGELLRRGCALNAQLEWRVDPVAARASVRRLRQLTDAVSAQWRLVCVNADPTDSSDLLGACPTHASIVRSDPKPDGKQRMEWLLARSAVAAAFSEMNITHLSSGVVVTPLPP
jgi:hypothetical protein